MTIIRGTYFYIHLDTNKYTVKPTGEQVRNSINSNLVNGRRELLADHFFDAVTNGQTFVPSTFAGSRKLANWNGQQIIALDFDDKDTTINAITKLATENNLHWNFGYKTFSHTEEHHRFRLIFILDKIITDIDQMKLIANYYKEIFPTADPTSFDLVHIFFGGPTDSGFKNGIDWDTTRTSTDKLIVAAQSATGRPTTPSNTNTSQVNWDVVQDDPGQPDKEDWKLASTNRNENLLKVLRSLANQFNLDSEQDKSFFRGTAFHIAKQIVPDQGTPGMEFPDHEIHSVISQVIKYAEQSEMKPSFKYLFTSQNNEVNGKDDSHMEKTLAENAMNYFIRPDVETIVPFDGKSYDVLGSQIDPYRALNKLQDLYPSRSNKQLEEVRGRLKMILGIDETLDDLVAFNNCVVDLRTGEQLPFDPLLNVRKRINFDYNPANTELDETFLDWCSNIFGSVEEGKKVISQMVGSLLTSNKLFKQMIIVQGKAGSGKSVLQELLKLIIPNKFAVGTQVNKLESRFTASELKNAYMAFQDDANSQLFTMTSILKSIVTGNEIRTEGKYVQGETNRINALIIANFNDIPTVPGANKPEVYDRLVILKWPQSVYRGTENEIIDFHKVLGSDENIEVLLVLAVKEIIESIQNNSTFFYETEKMVADKKEWSQSAVEPFENIVEDFSMTEELGTPRAEVYEYYCTELKTRFPDNKPLSEHKFWANMKEQFPLLKAKQKRLDKEIIRVTNVTCPSPASKYRIM